MYKWAEILSLFSLMISKPGYFWLSTLISRLIILSGCFSILDKFSEEVKPWVSRSSWMICWVIRKKFSKHKTESVYGVCIYGCSARTANHEGKFMLILPKVFLKRRIKRRRVSPVFLLKWHACLFYPLQPGRLLYHFPLSAR